MENIIKYQNMDSKLMQLEKKIATSEDKKVMNQMIAFVKDAQNKSLKLENQAKSMVEEYNQLQKEYEKNTKIIAELTAKKAEDLTEEETKEVFNRVNLVSSNLFMIERNLNIQLVNIKNILKEFESTKNSVIKARTKHKESKEKLDALLNQTNPEIEELKKEMKKQEPSLNKDLFEKYKQVKGDNIFPVFVKLTNNSCGGCRMSLPSNKVGKIKEDKFIVCEQCGRLIHE